MTRYVDPQAAAIDRLRAEAEIAGQIIEDLGRTLDDSEAMCDKYREALVHIDQVAAGLDLGAHQKLTLIHKITQDAIWTRQSDAA